MIEVVGVKEYAQFTSGYGNCKRWLYRPAEVEKRASRVKLCDVRERRITNVKFAVNCRRRDSRRSKGGVRESLRERDCHLGGIGPGNTRS
jgi:hypothetical protein